MSSQTGKSFGYRIQVRAPHAPVVFGEKWQGKPFVITDKWAAMPIKIGPDGVANPLHCRIASEEAGLLAYSTARALMASFAAGAGGAFSFLEFRLEKVRVDYSWKAESEGFSESVSFGFDAERECKFAAEPPPAAPGKERE